MPNIKALGLVVSDKNICLSRCKICDLRGWNIFGPKEIIRADLVEVHKVMLHTKYRGLRPCCFIPEYF